MLIKQVRLIALSHHHNTRNFFSFTEGLERYEKKTRQEFRTRIISNFLAGRLNNLIQGYINNDAPEKIMPYLTSAWTAAWFILSAILLIITFQEKSLLYIFGGYAGISFAYLPGMGIPTIYPWDMPVFFAFTVFVCLLEKEKYSHLLFFIPLSILLKETTILLSLAFLFWGEVPWKKRITHLVGVILLSLILKGGVDIITRNPSPIVTMTVSDAPGDWRLRENIEFLLRIATNNPLFLNAGLMTSLLLLPHLNPKIYLLKLIGCIFALGIFLFGVVGEYRIWFEMIPISLYGIDLSLVKGYINSYRS